MVTGTPNESVLRDPLDSFTDRERILSHFQQLLRSAQAGQFRLLAIKGNSGTGKTFLIEYLSQRICPQMGWQTGILAFAQSFPDFRSLLDGLENALKKCVPRQSLKQYRTQRDEYNRRFDEYRVAITVNQHVEARDSSSISHNQISVQIDTQLRQRELQLRSELTRALLELAEECEHSLCLFIDGYEQLAKADSELVGWLWEEVLIKLAKNAPQSVLVVTCGWEHPLSAAIQPFSTSDELDDFDRQRIKEYLQAQGILPHETSAQEPLISAFYDLSRGHPLVLSLAVTYFQALPEAERTPQSLQTSSALISEEARVQWLEERLLRRLEEPHRTLLEYGPLLRTFNQATLKALLNAKMDGKNGEMELDDRSYERFLRYPFINHKNTQGDGLLSQPTFHDLVRTVRIDALRRLHPETKQWLHLAMAVYYRGIIEAERRQDPLSHVYQAKTSEKKYAEWLAEIPEQEFRAQLEFLYHALQVKEMQAEAFNIWQSLVGQSVERWRRKQTRQLLELAQQVVAEEEPLLAKQKNPYGLYLIWYSRFLEQEARWNDALLALQEAVQIFDQGENLSGQVGCLNNIGWIYGLQGELSAALDYLKRALSLSEQVGNPAETALSLNNIGEIYRQQGDLTTALDCQKRALSLREQVDNPAAIAISLNNIGLIYQQQGQLSTALDSHQRALPLFEQIGNPAHIAQSLNNIGGIYQQQGQLATALDYQKRALSLFEQVGNPAHIAQSLNNIGAIYDSQGDLATALDYFLRALSLFEQVGNPAHIATSLNNIGAIYDSQGDLAMALDSHQRALSLREQVGNPAEIALSCHNLAELYQQQEQWQDAIVLFSRALSLSEQMGHGFESDVADESEGLAICYAKLGEIEKAEPYEIQAQQIREQLRKGQA